MYPEAIDEANKARSLYESPRSASFLGFALARAGKTKEAMVELNGLLALSRKEYVSPYNIAMIYAGLGNADKAIDWLEKGIEVRDPRMTFLKVEPKWNSLRGDERFVSVKRQMAFGKD
jgi:tetratricopeptide (TPR) repeat protein